MTTLSIETCAVAHDVMVDFVLDAEWKNHADARRYADTVCAAMNELAKAVHDTKTYHVVLDATHKPHPALVIRVQS